MIIRADARHIPLVDGCVQCAVTSPPYFGLRDYGNQQQIGLEPTPAAYVEALVGVFEEVRRVLRDDGTVWLNLGDSYCNADKWGGGGVNTGKHTRTVDGEVPSWSGVRRKWAGVDGLKPKDLIGIPWSVAFALRDAGWYLRSDIVWSKPNPMPESVTDRPTKAHEYLFLLTKSERYAYDAAAICEPYAESTIREAMSGYDGSATKDYASAGVQNPSDTKRRIQEGIRSQRLDRESHHGRVGAPTGRNKRSVWTVNTQPYSGAHFATMPEALVEPCILAGCPAGGLVFDPFLGSGTVGVVAERLGRRWVGTDLSYQPLSKKRTAQRGIRFDQPMSFAAVDPHADSTGNPSTRV